MRPLGVRRLLDRMARELEGERAIFGIPEEAFVRRRARPVTVLGEECGLPLGPAAGPHTQLAQNIVAAWLCGARYVELKTVQIRDSLEIARPCIDTRDEGYNTEWSQELCLDDAFSEYLAAHVALRALAGRLRLGGATVFAMSVGYDLAGIRSPRVDAFIERMRDVRADPFAERQWEACLRELARGSWGAPEVPPTLCRSVTLSTMHGCPAREIEEICRHLMQRKRLATIVKLNPTLVGLPDARSALRGLGWDEVEPLASCFEKDIGFRDAVAMVERLRDLARREGVGFGVKLSNTLGVANRGGALPGEEMYLSGRALAPLSLLAASRLADALGPELVISYSGGASAANVGALLAAGLAPVTVATELLKPGGYLRLAGMAEIAAEAVDAGLPARLDPAAIRRLAAESREDPYYRKQPGPRRRAAVGGPLPVADCVAAPCVAACPIGQRVPEYVRLQGDGRAEDAAALIRCHNVLPGITGRICDHPCMERCARGDYEGPVLIRDMKRIAVESARDRSPGRTPAGAAPEAGRVAVIGAGPSGLAAAAYLARCGVGVTVFERRNAAGGVVTSVLPPYRLPPEVAAADLAGIVRLGVEIRAGADGRFDPAALLARGYAHVYVATGAGIERELALEGGARPVPALAFLAAYREAPESLDVGRRVAVVGGGNTAVDGARSAKRIAGVDWVGIVYRRSEAEMPADCEELDNARAEGVELLTLLAPVSFEGGVLRCRRMRLGLPGADGRRSPEPTGESLDLRVDTVISAIGEVPEAEPLRAAGLALDARGLVVVDPGTQETSVSGVFAGGDAVRGGGTVVLAMADARRAAREIVRRLGVAWRDGEAPRSGSPSRGVEKRRARLVPADGGDDGQTVARESLRCLACDSICDRCVEVCPNRANVAVRVPGLRDATQIVHLDEMCNDCGACATFCLYEGKPYRDKVTFFATPERFRESTSPGVLVAAGRIEAVRGPEGEASIVRAIAEAVLRDHPYLVQEGMR